MNCAEIWQSAFWNSPCKGPGAGGPGVSEEQRRCVCLGQSGLGG